MATNIYLETSQPAVEFAGQLLTKKNIVAKGGVDFSGATSVALPSTVTTTGALVLTAASASNYVPLALTQNDTTNNPNTLNITDAGTGTALNISKTGATGDPISIVSSSGWRMNFQRSATGVNASNPVMWVEESNASDTSGVIEASNAGTGASFHSLMSPASNTGVPAFLSDGTQTITGAVTDGYQGGFRFTPTYTAATAQTVTRHNYLDINNPTLSGLGPAALTDATVMRFDANAGTHKAVDAGTTKTSPGTVTQWIKINVNGTLAYIPSYSSKTS